MSSIMRNTIAATAIALAGLASVAARAAEQPNLETIQDIEKHFGVVPNFF
ncbi:MAG: hypothetical protein WD036_12640 [Bauldia sp.]